MGRQSHGPRTSENVLGSNCFFRSGCTTSPLNVVALSYSLRQQLKSTRTIAVLEVEDSATVARPVDILQPTAKLNIITSLNIANIAH
jgi:hypothetical protein